MRFQCSERMGTISLDFIADGIWSLRRRVIIPSSCAGLIIMMPIVSGPGQPLPPLRACAESSCCSLQTQDKTEEQATQEGQESLFLEIFKKKTFWSYCYTLFGTKQEWGNQWNKIRPFYENLRYNKCGLTNCQRKKASLIKWNRDKLAWGKIVLD